MTGVIDPFGRRIDYLRIAVTDRCNLRCIYCMPPQGVPRIPHGEVLSYEEIRAVVHAAAELGISRIRLTGGEPLVRAGLPELVRMLSKLDGVRELSLTTNGTFLKEHALTLKEAGLSRVNVSLDTLRADKFRSITRLGSLETVVEGIQAAKGAGFDPVKINTVVMRGVNDDEVPDLARMTYEDGWHIRFIELMPFRRAADFVPSPELRERIGLLGGLEPCPDATAITGNGPAVYYRLAGATGTIGFVSAFSDVSFCSRCNRMRLSSDGKLRPCLLAEDEIDLKAALRNDSTLSELQDLILGAVASKQEHHQLRGGKSARLEAGGMGRVNKRMMSQIGG